MSKQGRGAGIEPTSRMLDALAAWWQSGGSNIEAADMMGITPQVMRNTMMAFRRQERSTSNLILAQRYRLKIERRRVLKAKPRKKAA